MGCSIMPRPKGSKNKKEKENKKDVCLYVRCTEEEKQKLFTLAEEKNISVSKFILNKCFE